MNQRLFDNNIQRTIPPKKDGFFVLPGKDQKIIKIDTSIAPEIVLNKSQKESIDGFLTERMNADNFLYHNLPFSNRLLLYGPPGNGKTTCALYIANKLGMSMNVISLSEIVGSRLGETQGNIGKAFFDADFNKSILFIDELDSIGSKRGNQKDLPEINRVLTALLQLFDLYNKVIIIGATNMINSIDEALIRRFDMKIEYGNPDVDHIKEYLNMLKKKYIFDIHNIDEYANSYLGKSCSDIEKEVILHLKKMITLPGYKIGDQIVLCLNEDNI